MVTSQTSKEGWYGVWLVVFLVGMGVVLMGLVCWWGYTRIYPSLNQKKVSITDIPQGEVSAQTVSEKITTETPVIPAVAAPGVEPKTETEDVKQLVIAVLNGGGVKGSAAAVATLLKQTGYTKVSTGNTQKDYTGMTVYFAPGKDTAAATIKKLLLKQYPKTLSKEAPKTDAEASLAEIVVIIGK